MLNRGDYPTGVDVNHTLCILNEVAGDCSRAAGLSQAEELAFSGRMLARRAIIVGSLPSNRDAEWSTIREIMADSLRECIAVLEKR